MKKSKEPAGIKIVLDTNCCVAAILSDSGASAEVLKRAIKGDFFNFYTQEILEELREVLARPKFALEKDKREHFVHLVQEASFEVRQLDAYKVSQCRDPDDDKFISLANQIEADFILTIDRDLLSLREIGKTKIVKPCDILVILPDA